MLRIGLTGGIATGKSTVAKMLIQLGAPVFDADREAHRLLAKGGGAYGQIKAKFVDQLALDILAENNEIDRKKLGAIVFSRKELLHFLEQVMHSQIREKCDAFIKLHENDDLPAIVLDIPLLVENFAKGWQQRVDCIWLVYISRDLQKTRLQRRENISNDEVEKRLMAQMPIEEKRQYADVIIDNTNDLACTQKQLTEAWNEIVLSGGKHV